MKMGHERRPIFHVMTADLAEITLAALVGCMTDGCIAIQIVLILFPVLPVCLSPPATNLYVNTVRALTRTRRALLCQSTDAT
jgi:hypothetical protein